jgi:hypothetical protein
MCYENFAGLEGHAMITRAITVAAVLAVAALILLILPRTRHRTSWLAVACVFVFVALWIEKGLGLVVTGFVPSPLGRVADCTPTPP